MCSEGCDGGRICVQVKRSSRPRGPYNSDRRSRYVELVLVVDQDVYREYGDDLKATVRRTKQIANIVNSVSHKAHTAAARTAAGGRRHAA